MISLSRTVDLHGVIGAVKALAQHVANAANTSVEATVEQKREATMEKTDRSTCCFLNNHFFFLYLCMHRRHQEQC
jgi:hypothetical protein